MGDGVDKTILLLIAANLTDEEDGVEDDASDDQREKQHAQNQHQAGAPVQYNPTDIEGYRERDQAGPKRDEKSN